MKKITVGGKDLYVGTDIYSGGSEWVVSESPDDHSGEYLTFGHRDDLIEFAQKLLALYQTKQKKAATK